MFWLRSGLLWLGSAVIALAHAQIIPALASLPAEWQTLEEWRWQGRLIQSQRFSSNKSATELIQILPELLQQELTAVALSSAQVVSFFEQDRHFLLWLSTQPQGTSGWLSSLDLKEQPLPIAPVFSGLYEHIWSMQAQGPGPVYVVLRPQSPVTRTWHALHHRLIAQGWSGSPHFCLSSLPCEWTQEKQRLILWRDLKQEFWHVLWWQS